MTPQSRDTRSTGDLAAAGSSSTPPEKPVEPAMVTQMLDMVLNQQKVAYDEAFKMWQRLFSVPRVVEQARDNQVCQTPHEVVYEEDQLRLLHYNRDTPPAYREPLLICYALVNRPYILDLQPEKSVVRQFLARGFDVYLIDWGIATAADQSLTLHDYVRVQMGNVSEFLLRHCKTKQYNLLGYCMGGTMASLFTATSPAMVKNLALMAAPLDFSGDESLLQVWTKEEFFDVDALVDSFGNCPAPFLQHMFQMMKPVQNYVSKYTSFFDKMYDDRFVENFFAMEKWTNDNIPVAGETFREFVKKLYQRNELVKGQFRFKLNEPPVDLKKITCPLLLMVAKGDHLVPPSQTLGLAPFVGSKDIKTMEIEAGHVGLAVSSKAHKKFWPEATAWMAERSTPMKSKV
ncbi:MAG: class III poly(R)-hydroxyalkanoic acid synthase subunit PhaC [Isosphaeraceae bacterium]